MIILIDMVLTLVFLTTCFYGPLWLFVIITILLFSFKIWDGYKTHQAIKRINRLRQEIKVMQNGVDL